MPTSLFSRPRGRRSGAGLTPARGSGHDGAMENAPRIGVLGAARTAWDLVRRNLITWIVAVVAVQFLLVWVVLPSLQVVFRGALAVAGVDGISQVTALVLLFNPLALLALAGFLVVGAAFVFLELTLFAVVAHTLMDGRAPTFRNTAHGVWTAARKLRFGGALLFIGYGVVLVPLSGVGVSSELTGHVSVPRFISGEVIKTPSGAVWWLIGVVLLGYAALLLSQTMANLTGDAPSMATAMGRSIRSLWFRRQFGVVVVIVAVGATAIVLLALIAGVGSLFVVAAGEDGAELAAASLAALDAARTVVGGFAIVFLTGFFVALSREQSVVPVDAPTPVFTRYAAAAVLAIAAVIVVPRVVSAGESVADQDAIDTLVIGHRGFVAHGVENSIAGLEAAAAAGASMVEIDVQETADREWVVIHDANLGRLVGIDANVHDLTLDELRVMEQFQAGMTAPIPSLEEFVSRAHELDVPLLIEVKPHGRESPGYEQRLSALLATADPDRVDMVQSLDAGFIEEFTAIDPDRQVAFVVGFHLGRLPDTPAQTVAIEDWSYADAMLADAHEDGKRIFVWTLNDPGLIIDYVQRGVDGIITDTVDTAVAIDELAAVMPPAQDYWFAAARIVLP